MNVQDAAALMDDQPEVAYAMLQEITRSDPDNDKALYMLGIIHLRAERLAEGLGLFERLVKLTPKRAAAWNGLGQVLSEQGKTTEARQAFKQAQTLSPSALFLSNLGTGRDAVFIPDPYEQPEKLARVHGWLLWFGFRTNLIDLHPLVPSLITRWPLQIVSNAESYPLEVTQWSPEAMNNAFDQSGLVIIPTGKSMAKSANRAIDSIRRGLYPVCGHLPAYSDLGVWQGDIVQGIEWALSHQDEVIKRIKNAQHYIRSEYSPQRIGKLWYEALNHE